MTNELIFVAQSLVISGAALGALRFGSQALVAFICLVCILANLFVTKQIMLFGLNATSSDAFTIGATLGLNLLQEYYGRAITRKTIWINFFLLIFYAVMSQIHLLYVPSSFDSAQPHFVALLSLMPRLAAASLTVYMIAQSADYLLFGFFKRITRGRFLIVRNYASMLISQLLDTILFSFLGLYGVIDNLGEIIIISYAIKIVAIAISAPFMYFSRSIMNVSDGS